MAYVTPGRVRSISLPDGGDSADLVDKATPASMSDVALNVAIADAQAIVDGRLGAQYVVPFNPVPSLIETLTAFEAAYLAELTLRKTKDLEERDPFWLRHLWVLAMLDQLAAGTIVLPGVDPIVTGPASSEVINQYEGYMWLPQDFDMREVEPPRGYV